MSEVLTSDNINSLQVSDPELEEMVKVGVHLGHAKSKNHPSMLGYIYGVRNTVSIVDLTKTKEKLAGALNFLREVVGKNGVVLLVGTRPAARKVVQELGDRTQMPYYVERWIGGTLTNFKVILKRIEYMESIERAKASGDFEKYTKKERMKKEEDLSRLRKNFDGVRMLKRLPDAVFVVDTTEDTTAVREAKRIKIPLVALSDTNSNLDLIDYPIPANDDALSAVRYMVNRIGSAIDDGLAKRQEVNAAAGAVESSETG